LSKASNYLYLLMVVLCYGDEVFFEVFQKKTHFFVWLYKKVCKNVSPIELVFRLS